MTATFDLTPEQVEALRRLARTPEAEREPWELEDCEHCGKPIEGRQACARYCSNSCRNKAYEARQRRRQREAEAS